MTTRLCLLVSLLCIGGLSQVYWPQFKVNTGSAQQVTQFGRSIAADEFYGPTNSLSVAAGAPGIDTVQMYSVSDDGKQLSPTAQVLPALPTDTQNRTGIFFGYSVSVHGDCLVVGAPCDLGVDSVTKSGSVWYYRLQNGIWTFVSRLVLPSTITAQDCANNPKKGFGTSVRAVLTVYGAFILASGNGVAMKYTCNSTWCDDGSQMTTGGTMDSSFGEVTSATPDGFRAVVASPASKTVDVFLLSTDFTYPFGVPSFETSLSPPASSPSFGTTVVMNKWGLNNGDAVVAVGDPDYGNGVGAVHVYEYWKTGGIVPSGPQGSWNFVQTLVPPTNFSQGSSTYGFGISIGMKSRYIAVGTKQGKVHFFTVSNTTVMTDGQRYTHVNAVPYDPTYRGAMTTEVWYKYGYDAMQQASTYIFLIFSGFQNTMFYSRPFCGPAYADPLCQTVCPIVPIGGIGCNNGPTGDGTLILPPGVPGPVYNTTPPDITTTTTSFSTTTDSSTSSTTSFPTPTPVKKASSSLLYASVINALLLLLMLVVLV